MTILEMEPMHVNELQPIGEPETKGEFVRRHIGPDDEAIDAMLRSLNVSTLDALIEQVVPRSIRRARPMRLPAAKSEAAVLAVLRDIASENRVLRSFIGMGYSNCHVPTVIQRNVLRIPPGTPPTRPTNPRSRKAVWKRCSIFRRW